MEKCALENIIKKKLHRRPYRYVDNAGQRIMFAPFSHRIKHKWDEESVVANIIANMKVFGRWYSALQPNLYLESGLHSGVMVTMSAPTQKIENGLSFPGDIDILIVPYADDFLLPSLATVVEIKILRAEKRRLSKSPNQFGFSQASSLLEHGFPYVSIGHIIVTDDVRDEPNREMLLARVGHQDSIVSLAPIMEDAFEIDLRNRTFGRLVSNTPKDDIGLFAMNFDGSRIFEALGKACRFNLNYDSVLMDGIHRFYEENTNLFIEIPRYSDEEIKAWEMQLKNNPNTLTPWGLSRRMFRDKWIRSVETLAVDVDGQQRVAEAYHTNDGVYLYY